MTRDERIDAWVAKTLNTLPRTTDEQRAAVVRILAAPKRAITTGKAAPRTTVRQAA
ncbi:hypothetical protein ABZX66_20820 [Micromonospora aurantiaca]|uniref:hypothetical protein n=1 Tax=Micromonospora TaxID=1873 RepID=UPI00296F32BD|nr:hypothetical protein [Micromonospora sp. BRA006-A]MDW3849679.1 hypothetical protein [Micromonospora sp. BRA006-A]